jgi:hypothetical protein
MTRLVMAVVCTALIGSTACKKENTATPFKPEGYWRGSAYLFHTAILNKPNGDSRLYLKFSNTDTASAESKGDGKYIVSGKYFRAAYGVNQKDSIVIESYNASSPNLKGTLILSTGEIVPFEFFKQN